MKPIKAITKLLTAKRRASQDHADFITVIRQAAALLAAGRPLTQLWPEVAAAHEPCGTTPVAHEPDPQCCMHHVLVAQRPAAMLGQPYFSQTTGPSSPAGWQQLSATLTLAQHTGMSVADTFYRLADALEAGEDAHQAREAASAGPKATASLLAWLPVAGLGLAHMLGASLADLLTSVTGWALVTTGAIFAVVGRWWTTRMIRTAQES